MKNVKPVQSAVIIDDNECYVITLERMLSIHQIAESVHSFPNGKEAFDYLSMVKSYPDQIPDIIFLDINMPTMNGWQFLDDFRKIRSQVKKKVSIYMLSSSMSITDVQIAKSYPEVSGYLIKPATKADLFRVLEEVAATVPNVKAAAGVANPAGSASATEKIR